MSARDLPETSNVDRAELDKFEALAHRFWDPDGEFRPLHRLNPTRAQFIIDRAPVAGTRVLDVGCGGGLLAESLRRAGGAVTAIDLAPAMIDAARLHAAQSGLAIDYRVASADSVARAEPQSFDIVTCMEMLEHVPDPAAMLSSLAQLARPGGHVFVSTIHRNLRSFLSAIVAAEYVLRLLPRGTHEYEKLIRPSELARWGRAAGLSLLEIAGLDFDPFSGRCMLSHDPSVNYLAHFVSARPVRALPGTDASHGSTSAGSTAALGVPPKAAASCRAVLLDLDGTLLDTARDLASALDELRRQEGLGPLDFATVRGFVSHGALALARLGFPRASESELPALRDRLVEIYGAALAVHTRPFEGMLELLEHLERESVPWGVVTNKPQALAERVLDALGLAARAGVIVGGDRLPERKPHPRPLLFAAERLGASPAQTVFVGDAERDVLAARAAGMQAVVACFGYIGPQDDPRAWPADAWLASPREILDWLRRREPQAPAR